MKSETSIKAGGKIQLDALKQFLPVVVLVILVIVSSILSKNFLAPQNIFNLLRQNAGTAIISMGMLLVILTGGIDLSVGSIAAFAAVVFTTLLDTRTGSGWPLGWSFVVTLLLSAAFGLLAGYLIAYQKMAAFVVTLATMTAGRGVAYMISHAKTIPITNEVVKSFNKGNLFSVPYSVILAGAVVLIVGLVLKYTSYGRFVRAIGSNESAIQLSGIRTSLYVMSVYVICSVLCVLGGIVESRSGVGDARICTGMELDAIAACVIGGASLTGGKGTALNTLMGVLILGLISNIMALMKVASYPQQVIKGIIIILAVLMQGRPKKN